MDFPKGMGRISIVLQYLGGAMLLVYHLLEISRSFGTRSSGQRFGNLHAESRAGFQVYGEELRVLKVTQPQEQ